MERSKDKIRILTPLERRKPLGILKKGSQDNKRNDKWSKRVSLLAPDHFSSSMPLVNIFKAWWGGSGGKS